MSESTVTATAGKRITVSVPAELIGPLEAAAAREERSVSGQVVNIIREWVRRPKPVVASDEEFTALIREVRDAAARDDRSVPPTLQRLIARSYGG